MEHGATSYIMLTIEKQRGIFSMHLIFCCCCETELKTLSVCLLSCDLAEQQMTKLAHFEV